MKKGGSFVTSKIAYEDLTQLKSDLTLAQLSQNLNTGLSRVVFCLREFPPHIYELLPKHRYLSNLETKGISKKCTSSGSCVTFFSQHEKKRVVNCYLNLNFALGCIDSRTSTGSGGNQIQKISFQACIHSSFLYENYRGILLLSLLREDLPLQ